MIITLENISKSFGSNRVLKKINLSVKKGEILSIIDPSGAGKTTLLRTLNWLEKPDEGSVTIDRRGDGAGKSRGQGRDIASPIKNLDGVSALQSFQKQNNTPKRNRRAYRRQKIYPLRCGSPGNGTFKNSGA
jgi:ABC-type polar amino acid transport system ATPase subunit